MGSFDVPCTITEEEKRPLIAEEGDIRSSQSVQPPRGESYDLPDQPKPPRLATLDVFRGLAVLLMILVDDVGGIIPALNHSPWNGVTIADFVMPFFLFIVGVSLPLVNKRVSNKIAATQKAILRALKLIILGVVLQGGYFHGINNLTFGVNLENIRWLGILQRIAIGYFIAALCEIWLTSNTTVDSPMMLLKKYYAQWVVAISLSTLYLGLLYNLYVPDWKFEVQITNSSNIPSIQSNTVKCGVRGNLGPACNAVGMIDRSILGIEHLYQRPVYRRTKECSVDSPVDAPAWCQAPFDPEGLLSSIMAVVTCFIGLHFGHILVHFKGHSERILNCIIPSLGLVFFGILLETLGMPLNKPLYTFSYACVTSGAAGLLFIAIYLLVDLYGCRRPTMLLEWMGMNALTLYVLVASNLFFIAIQGFYWKTTENNIVTYIVQHGPWHHVGALRTPASSIRNYSDRSLTT